MGRTTDEIRKKIQIKEEKLDRKLTKEERHKITKNVKRKVARENLVRGLFMAIGISIGAGGHALLTAGSNENTNKNQVESEINLEDQNDRLEFVNSLKVDTVPINIENQLTEEQIRENVEKEINELETPEEILNYVKDIWANEYNTQNNEDITKEQVKFYKERETVNVFRDTATNGDTILREGKEHSNINTDAGVITAYINKTDNNTKQKIINYFGIYQTLYSMDENVEKYEDNLLVDLASIIDCGIDWSVVINQEETEYSVKQIYINRLIDAVTEYESRKTKEIEQNSGEIEL